MSKLKLDEKDLFKSEGSFCIGTTLLKYEALLPLRHAFWGMARAKLMAGRRKRQSVKHI